MLNIPDVPARTRAACCEAVWQATRDESSLGLNDALWRENAAGVIAPVAAAMWVVLHQDAMALRP